MDAIKNAIGGNKSSSTTGTNQQSTTGQQDYGDKGKPFNLPTYLLI